jgi:hypothetical protein
MKRLAFAAAVVLISASPMSAGVIGRPVMPYANLNAPPEAVGGIAGGPSVAAVDTLKQTVTGYEGGGPCGGVNYVEYAGDSGGDGAPVNYPLWIAGGLAGTAAFVLIGLRLLRRA